MSTAVPRKSNDDDKISGKNFIAHRFPLRYSYYSLHSKKPVSLGPYWQRYAQIEEWGKFQNSTHSLLHSPTWSSPTPTKKNVLVYQGDINQFQCIHHVRQKSVSNRHRKTSSVPSYAATQPCNREFSDRSRRSGPLNTRSSIQRMFSRMRPAQGWI